MGRKKVKKFIDKNNSITFQLVGRSHNDPLFVDETAPQYVLVEKKTRQEVLISDNLNNKDEDDKNEDKDKSKEKRREEQIKYGIYFDDDYDYLQHLTDVTEIPYSNGLDIKNEKKPPSIMLPSSVFESNVVENIDLNRKAALPVGPQLDWDPDIVEAMDDDFDFDDPNNQIDDDFVQQAMRSNDDDDVVDETINSEEEDNLSVCGYNGSDDDDDGGGGSGSGSDDDDDDAGGGSGSGSGIDLNRKFFDNEIDKQTIKTTASTHFTEYSISSSILPRNTRLQTLDEQFEQMFIREYSDQSKIGPLNDDDLSEDDDLIDKKLMEKLLNEYQEYKLCNGIEAYERNEQSIDYVRRKYLNDKYSNLNESDESNEEKEEIILLDNRKSNEQRYDCESILSIVSSNTDYHPKLLKSSTDRYGICIDQDDRRNFKKSFKNFNKKNDQIENETIKTNQTRLTQLSKRMKNETTEEKRMRKKQLREYRAERRAEKKLNRLTFRHEQLLLNKNEMNKSIQKKVNL